MISWSFISSALAAASTTLVAMAGVWRSPRLRANQAFAFGMLTVATLQVANAFTVTADQGVVQLSWSRIALLAEGLGPACWLFFSLTYARASTAKLSGKARIGVALLVLFPVVVAFFDWERLLTPPLDSYEPGRYLMLGSWGYLFVAFTLVAFIAPLINLEATLRASAGLGRWQTKFMILGVGLLLGFEIYALSYRLLFSFIDFSMIGPRAVIAIVASGLMAVSLLRARHGTVELSISQTALFRSVTLLFIGCYLIAVGIFTHLWSFIGGSNADILQGMLVLVAIVGLATLLLSSRFNARVKQALSRHFYSNRYDYRQEWLQLTERMGAHLGLEASLGVAVERLSEALSAPLVSAWLFDETGQRLQLAATVQVSSNEEAAWRAQPIAAPSLAAAFISWDGPRVIPSSADATDQITSDLRTVVQCTRAHMVAPLVTGGRVLGLLAIGPSATGREYGQEALLLAGAFAHQSATSVMTAQLSQKVMHAREAELSQLYSTFLVHDLKNLGTTLSLVAQNLSLQYADLRFRNDAQRVINQTVDKIKEMAERVNLLRQDYELTLEITDLNHLAEESLQVLNGSMTPTVTFEPTPLPPVRVDRRRFGLVLTNLLINAQEASSRSGGGIRLRTEHRDGVTSLSVIDDGCGMSVEFMDRHLFQPFHSTKPGGLGIGLYQSRKIIEAHGGRITVESRMGKGTTVSISLPTHGG